MKIETIQYHSLEKQIPRTGQHILAYQTEESIVVYQAYNNQIADFAVENQYLGGSHFSYNRMSWIKPNFLWMMFRCGWASKENQERVLALWLKKQDFEAILSQAVFSSFQEGKYENFQTWRDELDSKEVRLQWDPDHNPHGEKLARRAIQLGLKGKTLERFGKNSIQQIEDITEFVREQGQCVRANQLDSLLVPIEKIYTPNDKSLYAAIDIDETAY